MSPNEYQAEALRTVSGMDQTFPLGLNGVMGLAGESGECVDLMKKHLFQGHTLDKEHLAKELGDVAWYLAVTAHAIGYDLETILQMNVDKLRKRYPDGFDPTRSQHRAEGDV
jgi:NTP pyrophosphatase (non-canonical NTP hydrolase)